MSEFTDGCRKFERKWIKPILDSRGEALSCLDKIVKRRIDKRKKVSNMDGIVKVRAAPPRKLPVLGSGVFHGEQQYCYNMGYREGITALRKAQREWLREAREA